MPELPEVETTRRGIAPYVVGKKVARVVVRRGMLRWPVPEGLAKELPGQTIEAVERRGKYLLLRCPAGSVVIHLGMSGRLRVVPAAEPPEKHDHLDIILANGLSLRFTDPRRFGTVLWTTADPLAHPLLALLGPEPLEAGFDGGYLFRKSRGRKVSVKEFLMNSRVVAGIGNIYASEALFAAGIRPETTAGELTAARCNLLADGIREALTRALAAGEESLNQEAVREKAFGYFPFPFRVYGRAGKPCPRCNAPIDSFRQGGRMTYCCRRCQH